MTRQNHEKRSTRREVFEQPVALDFSVMDLGRPGYVQKEGLGADISTTGLGLTTDHGLIKGEVLLVRLPLNAVDVSLPVYAEVMWTCTDKGRCRAGLRFLV